MIANLGVAATLGFILGPIFGYFASFADFSIGPIIIDPSTSTGIF